MLPTPLTLATLPQHMLLVEGGEFEMGGKTFLLNAEPVQRVGVSSFQLCRYPVTQLLWKEVMHRNPTYFCGAQRPVEMVSWLQCQEFLEQLNALTGGKYRLPTEAEWEYAARGGRYSRGGKYAGGNQLDELAWHESNCLSETQPVGLKRPNELGIFEMTGNVWEWCEDRLHNNSNEPQLDRIGPHQRPFLLRGASYSGGTGYGIAVRDQALTPSSREIGFRLALSSQP